MFLARHLQNYSPPTLPQRSVSPPDPEDDDLDGTPTRPKGGRVPIGGSEPSFSADTGHDLSDGDERDLSDNRDGGHGLGNNNVSRDPRNTRNADFSLWDVDSRDTHNIDSRSARNVYSRDSRNARNAEPSDFDPRNTHNIDPCDTDNADSHNHNTGSYDSRDHNTDSRNHSADSRDTRSADSHDTRHTDLHNTHNADLRHPHNTSSPNHHNADSPDRHNVEQDLDDESTQDLDFESDEDTDGDDEDEHGRFLSAEEATGRQREMWGDVHTEVYPGKNAGAIHSEGIPTMKEYENTLGGPLPNRFAPFNSQTDWELAKWAKLRGPSSTAFTELMGVKGVCLFSVPLVPY
jgi:hypothetical protein